MIDETQEELAALYAFDLLEGAELTDTIVEFGSRVGTRSTTAPRLHPSIFFEAGRV